MIKLAIILYTIFTAGAMAFILWASFAAPQNALLYFVCACILGNAYGKTLALYLTRGK